MSTILNRASLSSGNCTATKTQAFAISAGTARKVVFCSMMNSGTKNVVSATFNGAACSRAGTSQSYGNMTHDWWYYDVPDALGAASYDVVLTANNSTDIGNTLAFWVTAGDTAGAPQFGFGTQASGVATVSGGVPEGNADAILTAASRSNPTGTSWDSATSPQVTVANVATSSLAGFRVGRADAIGNSTDTATITWTTNNTTNDLLMSAVNTTPSGGGPTVARSVFPFFLR